MSDIKRKKDYLFKYKNAIKCEERIKEKLDDIEAKINAGIQTGNHSSNGTSASFNTKAPFEHWVEMRDEYKQRLDRTREKSEAIKKEVLAVIDKVNNPLYCEILESYFIEFKAVEEICDNIDRTDRQWYRLYRNAILSIEI